MWNKVHVTLKVTEKDQWHANKLIININHRMLTVENKANPS
jgi:hypothetical protein